MLGSPPPYIPEPSSVSSWKRFLNWAKPPLGVTVQELRPDAAYVQLTLTAIYDIRLCEQVFEGWMTHLNSVTISSKKPDKREKLLRLYLGLLREDAGLCSRATNMLLQCHVRFAYLMAQRIDDASKSRFKGLKSDGSETTKLASDINQASRSLSSLVTRMKDNLSSFVSVLEEIEVSAKKERTLTGRILGWLKSLFKALARIFVTLGTLLSPFLHSAAPGVCGTEPTASTLWRAAAAFCKPASEPLEGRESESIESVLLFLKEIVPKEAQTAQKRLERFDKALLIMGLEAHMKTGRRVALRGQNPAAVAREWYDAVRQYKSVLPEDEGPDY